jgi:hypothetical protein
MPYANPKRDRNYKRENELYKSKPEQIKLRVERNKARKAALDAGLVHKGDNMDVDHKEPLSKGGSTKKSNLRIVPASDNRSFDRNADHSVKNNVPLKRKKK